MSVFQHPPKHYYCRKTSAAPALDGAISPDVWEAAPWTEDFVDIEGDVKPKPRFRTRAKMLWDDHNLYIAAELEEPQAWATLTEHDTVIFQDNDFEVFIDPDNDGLLYGEFEMNALNTTWDLLLIKPYRSGGPPVSGWDIKGLRTGVKVDGVLNDPAKGTKSWSVEIAIPFAALAEISRTPSPPSPTDMWRINFSRVEWNITVENGKYRKVPNRREDNWVWSPQGVVDMHRPEHWGYLHFLGEGQAPPPEPEPTNYFEAANLVEIWEAESAYFSSHRTFTSKPSELHSAVSADVLQATERCFEARIGTTWINHDLKFYRR
jgi:Carbohydrate family 9 binding domain-like